MTKNKSTRRLKQKRIVAPLTRITAGWRRRQRGRDLLVQLKQSDIAIVSYPKSGRTWLRMMMSHALELTFNIETDQILKFDNYHRLDHRVPKFLFTHDDYLEDIACEGRTSDFYRDIKTVLLVRDPIDIAVSYYFHWKYRWDVKKRIFHRFPIDDSLELYDFMIHPDAGLPRVIAFLNRWAQGWPTIEQSRLIRYEDLHQDPAAILRDLFGFVNVPVSEAHIRAAVDFGAFTNVRKLELSGTYAADGSKMKIIDKDNLDSFKARRGKVAGYRDYFSQSQIAYLEDYYRTRLDPLFGYCENRVSGLTGR